MLEMISKNPEGPSPRFCSHMSSHISSAMSTLNYLPSKTHAFVLCFAWLITICTVAWDNLARYQLQDVRVRGKPCGAE